MTKHERDKRNTGNYTVFMRGRPPDIDVIMVTLSGTQRSLTPQDALRFLDWLLEHKEELEAAAKWQEDHKTE